MIVFEAIDAGYGRGKRERWLPIRRVERRSVRARGVVEVEVQRLLDVIGSTGGGHHQAVRVPLHGQVARLRPCGYRLVVGGRGPVLLPELLLRQVVAEGRALRVGNLPYVLPEGSTVLHGKMNS